MISSPEEKIIEILQSLAPQMNDDLQKLLTYPTVRQEPELGAPFGGNIALALNFILDLAEKWGFKTQNLQGYVGIADYGNCPEQVGILCHLDVVPEGKGWTHKPFGGEIAKGLMFGRGAIDNKGPMIACFYAMRALKESKLPLKKSIRHIIGTNEESGFACMNYFVENYPLPQTGFVPDGQFPLIYAEKGIIHFRIGAPLKPTGDIQIVKMAGGAASNVIPDEAWAQLICSQENRLLAQDILKTYEGRKYLKLYPSDDGFRLEAEGKCAHGSLPFVGINAISILLGFLKRLPFAGPFQKDLLKLHDLICRDSEGIGLSVNLKDESGTLTLAPTLLSWDGEKGIEVESDIRYPISYTPDIMKEKIIHGLSRSNYTIRSWEAKAPHFMDPNDPLVLTLLAQYQKFTGDDSPPIAIGGGTYARTMKNFVAFGPVLPGQMQVAHQADEYISLDHLLLLAKIYATALYNLAK